MEASRDFNIKVKTMDSHFVELSVSTSHSIADIKKQLLEVELGLNRKLGSPLTNNGSYSEARSLTMRRTWPS